MPFELDSNDQARKEYLENKSLGLIKFGGLKKQIKFEDIKGKYSQYKDLSDFNDSILKRAEDFIPGYKNTNKRTKSEWLEVAKFIGSNIKTNNSEVLEKYAIQSWHDAKPNQKDNLNRQGKKYVKFTIDEWVNEVYKSAGVGEVIKNNNVKIPTSEDINRVNMPLINNFNILPNEVNTRKILNPNEIAQLSLEDANTTPKLPVRNRNFINDGDSHFYENIIYHYPYFHSF